MNTVIEQIQAGVKAHLQGNLKAAESAYLAAIDGFVCTQAGKTNG